MKRTIAYIGSPDECEELRKYFGVTEEELSRKEAADQDKSKNISLKKRVKRMEYLLTIIGERGCMDAYNINHLKDAVSAISHTELVSKLQGPIEGYVLHGYCLEVMSRQQAWEDEKNHLNATLRTAEMKTNEYEKTVEAKEGELQKTKNQLEEQEQKLTHQLEQTRQSLDSSREQIKTLTGELDQIKTESAETVERLTKQLAGSTKEIDHLTLELERTKVELNTNIREKEALHRDLEMNKQVLEQTTLERNVTRTELERYKVDFAKESKALKEVLDQIKQTMAEPQKGIGVEEPFKDSEETRDGDMASLAAEFGRLTVAIAEHLTLDHCLKLAGLLNVPASECDMVRRLSLFETPGIRFLDVLKKRQVINMFDVSNLQKGLAMLHLDVVNHDVVGPYQERVDEEQHKFCKVEEMFSWEDVNDYVKDAAERHQIKERQTSPQGESEFEEATQLGAKESWSKARVEDGGSHLTGRHHQLYTEQNVGKEGETIQLANVSLTVPPGALDEIHVIALSVMYEYPFPFDREVDTARMTPLIKLEPLGLTFKKSVQLCIPHFALIPEPENHDVIIYSGPISKTTEISSDSVQWTLERSLPWQLKEKSVTIDIKCLSYFSASLVSHNTAPPLFIVRTVPFVDGVRNANDDITLTICFCSDNESEYNMLLSENKKKLPLEQYSTLQLHRQSEKDGNSGGSVCVSVSSVNNSYVPDTELAVKNIAVSHLFAASRVSHKLKLRKNRQIGDDVIDLVLTFTQSETKVTEIFMKYRIKDLMISQESEDFLDSLPPDLTLYQNLKSKLASMLEKLHCRQLATYFDLSPAEAERVENHPTPGEMLMKILDEREKIMPEKMISLFQGLKCCHLDKLARLVSEYIEEYSKQIQKEKGSMMKNANGISKVVPTSQHQLKKQQFLSKNLAKKWQDVGQNLEVPNRELDDIQLNHHGNTQEAAYQMLRVWKQQKGSGATNGMLIDALKEAGRTDLAETVSRWKEPQGETSHFSKDRSVVSQTVVTGLGKKLAEQLLFDIAGVLFHIIQATV